MNTCRTLLAAALFAAKVTPVVTLHIPFGGDNHTDADLYDESEALAALLELVDGKFGGEP